MSEVAFQVKIHGLVQGVAYRASMQATAEKSQINGWVKNCPDGSVEAQVEGKAKAIEDLIAWCQKGPKSARVDRVDISVQPLQNFSKFIIK